MSNTLTLKQPAEITYSRMTEDKDILKIFPLVTQELKDLKVDMTRFSPDKILQAAYTCKTRGVLIQAVNDKQEIVGLMALCPQDSLWSVDMVLCNLLFYVVKEYRKTGVGSELIKLAKEYAKENKKELNIFIDSEEDLDKKDKLFVSHGFQRRGGTYRFVD